MKTFYSFIAKIFLVFSLCGVTMAQAQGLLVTDSTVHTSYGEATGSITLTAESDSTVRYLWSTSDTSHQITGLTVGDYSVTVTAGPDTFIHTYTIYYYVTWSVLYNVTESAAHELVCTNSIAPEDILGNYAYGKNVLKEDSNGVVMFHFKKGKAFSGLIGYTEKNFEEDDEGENQAAGVIVLTDSFADIPPGISILTGDEPMYLGTFDTSQDNTILVELRNDTAFLYKNGVLMLEFDYGESVRKVFPFVVPIDSGSYVKDVLCNYYSLRLEEEVEVTQLSCPGNNGSIDVSISGGFPPYSYTWSNSATTASISSLDAGIYTLTVTDDSNDELILSYDLSFPVQWDTLINFDEETDGSLTCNSADPAYAIGTNSLTSTQEGWVTFEIAEGEEFSGAIGLLDRLSLDEANLEANLILIEDSNMYLVGKAIDEVYLGNYTPGMPYIIRMELADDSVKVTKKENWSWGSTTETVVYSPHTVDVYPLAYSFADGSRLASIRSSFGCGNLRVTAEIFPAENIGATGSIYATVKGGTPPYTYAWSNGGASANLTNVSVDNYTLTVTDNTSATVSKTFLLGAYSYWDELDRMIETPEHVVHTDGSPYQEGGDYPLGFARGYNELRLDSTGSLVFEFTSGDDYGGILGLLQYPALEDTAMEYIAIGLLPDSMEDGHQLFILHNIDEGDIEYIGLAAKGISQRFRIVVGLDSVTVWKNELSSVTFPHTRTHNLRPMIAPILEESYVGKTLVDFGCVRPEPPTAPAPQSVCGDTAYTFTWDSIQVGLGGDSIEWSFESTFGSSFQIGNHGIISLDVDSGLVDTIWVRSISSSGCVSKTSFWRTDINTVPGIVLNPKDTSIYYGNDLVLAINGGTFHYWEELDTNASEIFIPAIDSSMIYHVVVTDTNGCSHHESANVEVLPVPICGFDSMWVMAMQSDTALEEHLAESAEYYKFYKENVVDTSAYENFSPQYKMGGGGTGGGNFVIPVVFIELYNNSTGSHYVSPQRINTALDILNWNFQNSNISFCMATKYLNGTSFTQDGSYPLGFFTVEHSQANNFPISSAGGLSSLTSISLLPPSNYLRVFIVENIAAGSNTVIGGMGTFPNTGSSFDGIIMKFDALGNTGNVNVSSCNCSMYPGWEEGEAFVHEVGHYLNLYHTFQGSCPGATYNCMLEGDYVCDTEQETQNQSFNTQYTNCSTLNPPLCSGVSDNWENYMGYKSDFCKSEFTPGQDVRMHTCLLNERAVLVSGQNLINVGISCTNSLPVILTAASNVCANQAVTFSTTASGVVSYAWNFDDGGTSSAAAPLHTFTTPGTYDIVLVVTYTGGATQANTLTLTVSSCPSIDCTQANWYFGEYAGIQFVSGALPTPNYAAYAAQTIVASEGVATVSNSSCQLLFYTDGNSIWDYNHSLVTSGLGGHTSAMQATLIVPWPGNAGYYYVFGTGAIESPASNLYYVVVNTNGGSVTAGSIQSIAAPSGSYYGEGLTAILNCDETGYWIFSSRHGGTPKLGRFLLTSSGIAAQSDVTLGTPVSFIKFSPNGLYFATVPYTTATIINVYEFDRTTGLPNSTTNVRTVPAPNYYGFSFSPNSQVLYVSEFKESSTNVSRIRQFDLTSPNPAATEYIVSSVLASITGSYSNLQLGPDGKLYVACFGSRAIASIANPDVLQAGCIFQNPGLYLDGIAPGQIKSNFGLPNLIDAKPISEIEADFTYIISSCSAVVFQPANICAGSFDWDFGDGSTSTSANPSHTYSTPGQYQVSLTVDGTAYAEQTISIGLTASSVAGPTTICHYGGQGLQANYSISATTYGSPAHYSWNVIGGTSLSSTTANNIDVSWNSALSTGIVTVTVTNNYGCSATAAKYVNILPGTTATAGNDGPKCQGNSISLTSTGGGTYQWSPTTGLSCSNCQSPTANISATQAYTVTVTVANGCTATASTTATVHSLPTATAGPGTTTACGILFPLSIGWTPTASGGTSPYTYNWAFSPTSGTLNATNVSNPTFTPTAYNEYTLSVTVTDVNGCTATHSTVYIVDAPINISGSIIHEETDCYSSSLGSIDATVTGGTSPYTYSWSNSATTQDVSALNAGTYTLTVTDAKACSSTASFTVNNLGGILPNAIHVGSGVSIPNLTAANLASLLTGGSASAVQVVVHGSFIFDGNFAFHNLSEIVMLPFATIVVPMGGQLKLDGNTLVHSCGDFMWSTIGVEAGGKLQIEVARIREGIAGVSAAPGSLIDIREGTFTDNYIGIHTPDATPLYSSFGQFTVRQSLFQGTSATSLIAPFSGQKAFAGILFNNILSVTVTNNNTFNTMNFGIIAKNTNLNVSSCSFQNIKWSGQTSGSGILVYSTDSKKSWYWLNQTGFGNSTSSPLSFSSCDNGILAVKYNLSVGRNHMNDMRHGVYSTQGYLSTQRITGNRINCSHRGIALYQNSTVYNVLISYNNITVNGLYPPGIGISAQESVTIPVVGYQIEHNPIVINMAAAGIDVNGLAHARLYENTITGQSTTFNRHGIGAARCVATRFNTNIVNGAGIGSATTYNYPIGIKAVSNKNNTYECNEVDNITTGIKFENINSDAIIRGNVMNDHRFGLWYNSTAVTGWQINRGNKWDHTSTSFDAKHDGPLGIVLQSLYYVKPLNSAFDPNTVSAVTTWFNPSQFNGPNFSCPSSSTGNGSHKSLIITNDTLNDYDYFTAAYDLDSVAYAAELEYQAERYLLRKLDEHPDMLTKDTVYQNFYDTANTRRIVKYYQTEQALQAALLPDSVETVQFEYYVSTADSLLRLMHIQDSILSLDTLDATDSLNALEELEVLKEVYDGMITDYIEFDSLTDSLLLVRIAGVQYLNNLLVDSTVYETNEKTLNTIYLNMLTMDSMALDSEAVATVYYIAHQCPLSGGEVVYWARSLYSLVDEGELYDDIQLCDTSSSAKHASYEEQATVPKEKLLEEGGIAIYPNPAKGEVTIAFKQVNEGTLIELTDLQGRKVLTKQTDAGEQKVTLNLTEVGSGIYTIRCLDGKNTIKTVKLVILK